MIYVASSWRNAHQPEVVEALRAGGLWSVYDFRHPAKDNKGFAWSDIDPEWQHWSTPQFMKALDHPIADKGFLLDMHALHECDACVLVLPCGRSAHLEAGYACGHGKPLAIYIPEPGEPELMYAMANLVTNDLATIVGWARGLGTQGHIQWTRDRWTRGATRD